MRRYLLKGILLAMLSVYSASLLAQVDTDFWFVVPEISHRGSTGGKPGTLRFATLELEATVTIEMPANPAFTPIILDIAANDDAAVDLSHLIDDAASPGITGLENKALNAQGINPYGLHITSTNMINAYWEVNYIFGADIWTMKGSNGLGTLFFTPFQTEYANHLTLMPSYSSIDVVASQDGTMVTFTLPDGIGASYGEPMNTTQTPAFPGRTFTIGPLMQGETFSLFPFMRSTTVGDKLAGTRIESNNPIAVITKDDNLNTASQGRSTVGDQMVPVDIAGDTYVVPAMGNPNLTYVVATQDNTPVYVNDVLVATLDEGEQTRIQSPNNQIIVISTKSGIAGPPGPPVYVLHMALTNMTRASALLPPIGCTGNTQLAFTRAREEVREKFYFFLITENENIDEFMIDGAPADPTIISDDLTSWDQLGNGWSALMTSNIPASKLSIGQHLVENTGGIFHLALMNGFTSANLGDMFYGYFSDYGGLNVGAVVAGTNSSVIRACYGTPVQLHAFGGTTYEWTPQDYLDDPYSNLPFAINLPAGAHEYVAHVSGACGSGDVPLTVVVAPEVRAAIETDVVSGCSPLTVEFEDASEGNATWQYDLGDGTPLILYDTLASTTTVGPPPDPFVFSNTYVNNTDSVITFQVTLMVKNSSACADIVTKTITVFPEIHSDFTVAPDIACDPLLSSFTNMSTGDTATWLWEFGDGGSSTQRDPVHEYRNLLNPDNLVLEASLVAISPYNCRDTSTRTVTIRPYIEAIFAYDTVAECSPHEIIITDQSIGVDNYQWDFGDGGSSTSSGPVLTHTYVNNGPAPITHTITLDVSNDEGCTHQIQRDVTIYPGVDADFSVDPGIACSPAELAFENLSSGPPGTIYLWDFGDGGSSTEVDPVHRYDRNLLRHDTTFTVSLVAITPEDCRDTAIFTVVLHPYIEAAFTVDDVVGCDPFDVEIHNESIGVDDFSWSFGDGSTSSTSDAILNHQYNNSGASTAVYPLRLVVSNTEGCRDTMIRDITVHPEITANFSFNQQQGCHPMTVEFTDLSVNAVAYLWDFGDGAASVEQSPTHTFTNFGSSDTTYRVTLTTSTADGECVKTIFWDFTVFPQVVAEFTFPQAQGCGPFEVEFDNLSIGGTSFRWDFDDGNTVNTNTPDSQIHTFVNNGFTDPQDFNVTLLVSNSDGCTSEQTKTVTVYPGIDALFNASDTAGCHPLEVDFTNMSSGGQTFVWDFGDGSTSNEFEPSYRFTNTGTADSVFTVALRTLAPNNICSDSFFVDITVHPYLKADFVLPERIDCTPFDVVIHNASVNASIFRWDFGDTSDTTTTDSGSLVHRFSNSSFVSRQDYEITLVAENFAGCTDELRRTITVEPDILADFTPGEVQGCQPLDVVFDDHSQGAGLYHWDFGNGTTSQVQEPTNVFTNLGTQDSTYRIWLRITASNLRCMDSTYREVVVHPFISADFTFLEQVNCSPSPVQFNNASVGGSSFMWDFGDGQDTIVSSTDPLSHVFTNSSFSSQGSFQVSLTAENDAGCQDHRIRTVEVYPNIDALFSSSVDEGCHPLTVDFSNLSQGGYTYSWDFGEGASSDADSPEYTFTNFTDAALTRTVRLTSTSQFDCAHEYSAQITIHPKPVARFETDAVIACPPFEISFTNSSLRADQYSWDLGGDTTIITGSVAPVSHVFDNLEDDIVTYPITLLTSTTYGCLDTAQQDVYVYPRTYADFSVNDGDCSPFYAYFVNESVRGEKFQWDFGDGTMASTTDPSNLYFNLSGVDEVYQITLTSYSQHGCVHSYTDSVDVYAQPDVEFIASPTHQMYPSSQVDFTNMSNQGYWDYNWYLGDGTTSSLENPPSHTYATWGEYIISLSASTPYCSDSVSHSVRILPATPIPAFDTIEGDCAPHTVQFVNNSIYGDSYLWEFDDGTTSTEFEPEHTFENYGFYNVKLTVSGPGGEEYAYRQVEVYRVPEANFRLSHELVMLPDDELWVFNLSKYGDTYLWDFGDGTTYTEENPSHLYQSVGIYDISLEVWSDHGCYDSIQKPRIIQVDAAGSIIFPNAFKPNLQGGNGGWYSLNNPEKNEIFHPLWEGVDKYKLEIYNNWGERLFTSTDVNIGWDGYHNGTLCSQDVYMYISSGYFINGLPFFRKGDVTLIHHDKSQR